MKPKPSLQAGVQHTDPKVPRHGRGRPKALVMPDPIPDTPENILRACMQGPPKKDWDYLKPGSDVYATDAPPTKWPPRRRS